MDTNCWKRLARSAESDLKGLFGVSAWRVVFEPVLDGRSVYVRVASVHGSRETIVSNVQARFAKAVIGCAERSIETRMDLDADGNQMMAVA